MSQFGLIIVPFEPALVISEDFIPPAFVIDEDTFAEALKKRWKDAIVQMRQVPSYEWVKEGEEMIFIQSANDVEICSWRIPSAEEQDSLNGNIKDYAVAFPEFPRTLVVEFTLWYRSFIDKSVDLYLSKPDDLEDFVLLTNTTTEEVIYKFLG